MMRYEGKVALVTGGRSGIGLATAERLESEGATVITAQRQVDDNRQGIVADLADPAAPAQIIDQVIANHGRLDLLVNNAGIMVEAYVEDMSPEDWHRTIAINLTAPFLLIRAALPHLRKTRGAIVNVGSVEGLGANPMHAAYGASKSGLHGMTKAVAVDHGPDGIRCNAVAPGWIDTDLNVDYINGMPDPVAFRAGLADIHPVGRTGKPEDIASLIAFLGSEDAGFITGQIYRIDGGRMTKLSLP